MCQVGFKMVMLLVFISFLGACTEKRFYSVNPQDTTEAQEPLEAEEEQQQVQQQAQQPQVPLQPSQPAQQPQVPLQPQEPQVSQQPEPSQQPQVPLQPSQPAQQPQVPLQPQQPQPVSLQPSVSLGMESFVLSAEKRKLDILFVVDNSFSMADMQKELSKRLSNFLSHLKSVDWRIGVLTTDMGTRGRAYQAGRLLEFSSGRKFIDASDSSYNLMFSQTICRPETGSSSEYPIGALLKAMEKKDGENQGFFRAGSFVVAILLTNEDEHNSRRLAGTEPSALVNFFNTNMSSHQSLRVYGISILPNDRDCLNLQNHGSYAHKVNELVQATGGENISICSQDYEVGLKNIGADAYRFMSPVLTLKEKPSTESQVQVLLMPAETPLLFSLDNKDITILSQLPSSQSQVQVKVKYPFINSL